MRNPLLGESRRDPADEEKDPPVAKVQITVAGKMREQELINRASALGLERGYEPVLVFHPQDQPGEEHSRYVLRFEVDFDDSMKDLILKPETVEAFRVGESLPPSLTLQTSYRAPVLVNEEMHGHFRLVDELQPLVADFASAIEAALA